MKKSKDLVQNKHYLKPVMLTCFKWIELPENVSINANLVTECDNTSVLVLSHLDIKHSRLQECKYSREINATLENENPSS